MWTRELPVLSPRAISRAACPVASLPVHPGRPDAQARHRTAPPPPSRLVPSLPDQPRHGRPPASRLFIPAVPLRMLMRTMPANGRRRPVLQVESQLGGSAAELERARSWRDGRHRVGPSRVPQLTRERSDSSGCRAAWDEEPVRLRGGWDIRDKWAGPRRSVEGQRSSWRVRHVVRCGDRGIRGAPRAVSV